MARRNNSKMHISESRDQSPEVQRSLSQKLLTTKTEATVFTSSSTLGAIFQFLPRFFSAASVFVVNCLLTYIIIVPPWYTIYIYTLASLKYVCMSKYRRHNTQY